MDDFADKLLYERKWAFDAQLVCFERCLLSIAVQLTVGVLLRSFNDTIALTSDALADQQQDRPVAAFDEEGDCDFQNITVGPSTGCE